MSQRLGCAQKERAFNTATDGCTGLTSCVHSSCAGPHTRPSTADYKVCHRGHNRSCLPTTTREIYSSVRHALMNSRHREPGCLPKLAHHVARFVSVVLRLRPRRSKTKTAEDRAYMIPHNPIPAYPPAHGLREPVPTAGAYWTAAVPDVSFISTK